MQESIVFLRVQRRRKESSRSLSHLLMSFLSLLSINEQLTSLHSVGPNYVSIIVTAAMCADCVPAPAASSSPQG